MSFNRLPHAHRFAQWAMTSVLPKKPAFVVVPLGVMNGTLQPWQESLYAWARREATAAVAGRRVRRGRGAMENN